MQENSALPGTNAWDFTYTIDDRNLLLTATRTFEDGDRIEDWNRWELGQDVPFAFGLAFKNPIDGWWYNLVSDVIPIALDEEPNLEEIEANPNLWMWGH